MATSTSSSVPSDHNAPLAVIDANNHGAWVLICNAFGTSVILITLIIRIYIRLRVSPPFGANDFVLAGATALAVVEVGIVFAQVDAGFGRSMDLLQLPQVVVIQKHAYAADVLFIAGLYTSKCCVVLFFKRISPSKASATFAWAALSFCLAALVASTLAVSLRCDLAHPWLSYGKSCSGLVARWKAVAALDITSEVLLFAMSLHLVWDLQTSMVRKSKVVFAFALRLLLIVIAVVRLEYLTKQKASSDPTLSGATAAVLTQVELFYSIVAATIPCLRPFLGAFVTNYGAMGGDTIMHGSHIVSSQNKESKSLQSTSFALHSLGSARRVMGRSEKDKEMSASRDLRNTSVDMLRPSAVSNRISAGHGKSQRNAEDAGSIGSEESTRGMIIRKEVAWQVDSQSSRTRSISSPPEGREAEEH